jgi:hypothetical protein
VGKFCGEVPLFLVVSGSAFFPLLGTLGWRLFPLLGELRLWSPPTFGDNIFLPLNLYKCYAKYYTVT